MQVCGLPELRGDRTFRALVEGGRSVATALAGRRAVRVDEVLRGHVARRVHQRPVRRAALRPVRGVHGARHGAWRTQGGWLGTMRNVECITYQQSIDIFERYTNLPGKLRYVTTT